MQIKDFLALANKIKTTLPIQDTVKVENGRMIAFDSNTEISIPAPEMYVDGYCYHTDTLKKLYAAKSIQKVEVNEAMAILKWEKGSYKMPVLSAENFPLFSEPETNAGTETVPLATLLKMVPFASDDELRPNFCGIHCNNKGNKDSWYIAASDSHVLCLTYIEASIDWFLPSYAFWALPKKGEMVTITKYVANGRTTLTLDFEDGYRIRTIMKLNGECPAFTNVIPTYSNIQCVFNKKEFNAALKSIKGLSQEHTPFYITLKAQSEDTLATLSCADKDFETEVNEVVDNLTTYHEPNTGEFRIRFKQSVLSLATNSVDSDQIEMLFGDSDRAAVIKEEGFTYLVMPLMDLK